MGAERTTTDRVRRLRPVWFGLTVVLLVLAGLETLVLFRVIDGQHAIGTDLDYYQFVAQRWLDTGVYYTERQLSGPYEVQTLVDNLYPPHALYLFVPFLVLPDILWWVIPLGVVAYVVWWCRPATWMWPVIALILLFPKTPNQILYGNTDMWVTAAIAGGVRWAWPSVFVTFKPSLVFFAVIGIRSRSWWIAAAILVLISLPFLSLWLEYPTVMGNSTAKFWYSFGNLPFFVLPILAYLGSTRRGGVPIGRWAAGLLRGGGATVKRIAEG
jgi:hypothetical protein